MKNNQLPIGPEQLRQARVTLNRYKEGKANLERRIVENEQWYKLRHWDCIRRNSPRDVEPTSAWLFNAIANKHADAMDNFPCPNVLPREEGDREEAKMLSSILPVILEQTEFEQVYDEIADSKLRSGTGVYGIFWDGGALGGLGDVAVRRVDVLNLFWENGVADIQRSGNLFHVQLEDNEVLAARYPQLKGRLGGSQGELSQQYLFDDRVDLSRKSAVIDWYYKKPGAAGTVLHYCKFVGDTLLFASENLPEYAEGGWYRHGKYPFVFDPLFRVEGSPCGFGYIDVAKSCQEYIDRGNQAILMNLLANARPRHFIRSDGTVNEAEYADLSRDFIHVQGNLGQDSILPVQGKTLSDIYVSVINNKIDELKEVTGNRDISTGGTSTGVTAASAIAAMQEAGSKLSRDSNKASYRAFRKVCLMVIELIRQFYDLPRCFRILGDQGKTEFVQYSNRRLVPQDMGEAMGIALGSRTPLFDITVSAQKQSPYSRLSQNELALQFYNAGFFDPDMAEQALMCLEMMDFDRRDEIMLKISQAAAAPRPQGKLRQGLAMNPALGSMAGAEHRFARQARQRVADSTAPG